MAAAPPADRDEPRAGQAMEPRPPMRADAGPGSETGAVDITHRRLSNLFGIDVQNLQGEELGELDNAMIDVNQGKLAFGIVAIRSGFLGMSKDLAAVPWSVLDFTSEPGIAKLDADQQTLMAMTFDEDNFPNLSDPQYSRQLYERYNAGPYGETLGFVPGEERRDRESPSARGNAPAMDASRMEAGRADLPFNPRSITTVQGAIESLDTYRIEGTSMEGLRLHVRTDAGRDVVVNVGPRSHLERENIDLQAGNQVTITGSSVHMGGQDVIVASQIRTGEKTLNLRDREGKPLWHGEHTAHGEHESASRPESPRMN